MDRPRPALDVVVRSPAARLRVEVRGVVRAAEFERDDVVDLNRAPVEAGWHPVLTLDRVLLALWDVADRGAAGDAEGLTSWPSSHLVPLQAAARFGSRKVVHPRPADRVCEPAARRGPYLSPFSLASRLLSNPGVDREVDARRRRPRRGRGSAGARGRSRDRAHRDGVVARLEGYGVSAADPRTNTGYDLAST